MVIRCHPRVHNLQILYLKGLWWLAFHRLQIRFPCLLPFCPSRLLAAINQLVEVGFALPKLILEWLFLLEFPLIEPPYDLQLSVLAVAAAVVKIHFLPLAFVVLLILSELLLFLFLICLQVLGVVWYSCRLYRHRELPFRQNQGLLDSVRCSIYLEKTEI